jgi:hypothetical protein
VSVPIEREPASTPVLAGNANLPAEALAVHGSARAGDDLTVDVV